MSKLQSIFSVIRDELRKTIANPARLKNLARPDKIGRFLSYNRVAIKAKGEWNKSARSGLSQRDYSDYEDYIQVQSSKLEYLDLESHEVRFREALKSRLEDLDFVGRAQSVVCLGARLGAEVRSFLDLGCFAIGIDLNPGEKNSYVLHGDFHKLVLADSSVDIVYSNSLDHAYTLDGMVAEIKRVVKTGGHIILEPDPGVRDESGIDPDLWAAQSWATVDDLVDYLEGKELKLILRRSFEYPRLGQQLVFQPKLSQV